METTRRSLLKGLSILPMAMAAKSVAPTPLGQPEPIKCMVYDLEGTTSIVRVWNAQDARRCRLCPRGRCHVAEVGAVAVCGLLTDDRNITLEGAPLYDSHHLELID